MKYSVITFGCRVNQADSLAIETDLLAAGAEPAPAGDADLVVVNTCSVTSTADQGARQTIRRIARDNPRARIVVTGCYATRRPSEAGALPNVAQVVCNDDKPQLVPLLKRATTVVPPGFGDGPCGAAVEPGVAGRTAFTLRVQTGCDEPCSYCIIPATRGAPRSVAVEDVLREVRRAAAAGFKEIALTGVHLGSYGRDLSPQSSLIDLLQILDRQPAFTEPVRFRISSLEPMDCPRALVDLVATSHCFAPHFHLPLQHASDRMLAAMRRPYTIAYYSRLVDGIRSRIPDASIGSDVIVGFPGERENDFEALAEYLERSPLTHVHVFPYSDRPGTAAAAMNDRVPGPVVRERARRIRDVGARLTERFRAAQAGSVHRALTLDDGSVALTGNYLKVAIPAGQPRNRWITARITGADAGVMRAEIVALSAPSAAESSAPAPA
jgi:threonylcarbamoyladenosine tRNA methylthiotransferase MtaB